MAVRAPDREKILEALYEGPLSDVPWHNFARVLRLAMDAIAVTLFLKPPREGDPGIMINEPGTPKWESAYTDSYFSMDPFVDLPPGKVVRVDDIMPMEDYVARRFYTEFMEPGGAHHVMGVDLEIEGGPQVRLRVTRGPDGLGFSEDDKAFCQGLVPHFERAVRLYTRLAGVEAERALYQNTLGRLDVGTVVIDENSRVLSMNDVAREICEAGDVLGVASETLKAIDPDADAKLRDLVAGALAARKAPTPRLAEATRMERRSGEGYLGVLARPVPPEETAKTDPRPAVVLYLTDSLDRHRTSRKAIRGLFGLTEAEAWLAVMLARGLSLDESAAELGVTRNTARAQLRSVFSKTGVGRQAELVRLILSSVATLG